MAWSERFSKRADRWGQLVESRLGSESRVGRWAIDNEQRDFPTMLPPLVLGISSVVAVNGGLLAIALYTAAETPIRAVRRSSE
jgi:hypothetical protein